MIARCGLRTHLPDAGSCAELAGAARPLRHRQGRRDPDAASRGRRSVIPAASGAGGRGVPPRTHGEHPVSQVDPIGHGGPPTRASDSQTRPIIDQLDKRAETATTTAPHRGGPSHRLARPTAGWRLSESGDRPSAGTMRLAWSAGAGSQRSGPTVIPAPAPSTRHVRQGLRSAATNRRHRSPRCHPTAYLTISSRGTPSV
jgi:hypothetical protein